MSTTGFPFRSASLTLFLPSASASSKAGAVWPTVRLPCWRFGVAFGCCAATTEASAQTTAPSPSIPLVFMEILPRRVPKDPISLGGRHPERRPSLSQQRLYSRRDGYDDSLVLSGFRWCPRS